jgi:hypothetical protein
MARISLASHWKFRRLCRGIAALAPPPDQLIGPTPIARGLLELLWESGYATISAHVGTPEELAELVHWRGDPVVLATLLVDAGFLDQPSPGQYAIHDLWEHAPRYAKLRYQRKLSDLSDKCPTKSDVCPTKSDVCPTNDHVLSDLWSENFGRTRQGKASPDQGDKSSAAYASRSPDGDEDQKPDPRQIVPLGYELVRQGQRFTTEADAKDALAYLAARYGIPYDGASLAAALDALKHAKAPLFVHGATG